MNETLLDPPVQRQRHDPEAFEAEREAQITRFVRSNPDYYIEQFGRISRSSAFTPTLNVTAGLLGPIWFGARGLWKWAVTFLIIETFAFVQMALGWFGDLSAAARNALPRSKARSHSGSSSWHQRSKRSPRRLMYTSAR